MNYDVIIIGAGSAGLMTARVLGSYKHKVLLIEKKTDLLNLPFRTLGSFIDLDEFGLSDEVVASNINKATVYSKHLSCSAYGYAYILDKVKLHNELINKIDKKFVDIVTGTTVKSFTLNQSGGIGEILDNKGNTYTARYYIDCTGLAGFFSKKFGLQDSKMKVAVGLEFNVAYKGNPNETHFYLGKDFRGGYGWIFPLKNQRAILGFGSFERLVIQELRIRVNRMFEIDKITKLVEKDNDKAEGGTIPVTNVKTKLIKDNLICVGDSISQVNPIVGEGYRYIFKSAVLASNAINDALSNDTNSSDSLREYETKWRDHFYNRYKVAKMLQKKLDRFSKSDLLVDLGVMFLKTKRHRTIERLYSGEFSRRDLFLP